MKALFWLQCKKVFFFFFLQKGENVQSKNEIKMNKRKTNKRKEN